jgi:hypothetical protein
MITVTFHSPTDSNTSTDEFDGTVTELIFDLLTDEWPYEFFSSFDDILTFVRIGTNDMVSFSTK